MIHGPSSVFIWRLVDVSWFSSLYKRCVFSRGTFLSLKLSLYLLSFLSCIDSRENAFGVFWIMIHGPSSVFIWRLVDVSWFSVSNKSWALREEHFCHWNFRSISPHSWVVLILVRKPLGVLDYDPWSFKRIYLTTRWDKYARRTMDHNPKHSKGFLTRINITQGWGDIDSREKAFGCFGLWSMVLQAYLSDDSLMWADFQVNIKDASFREEHFCHWNFRSISSHSWVVLILVRMPLECLDYDPRSF